MAITTNRRKNFTTKKQSLGDLLNDIFKVFMEGEEYYHRIGIVKSVNVQEAVCEVEIVNGDTLPDVRLQQVKNDEGVLMVPTINRPVLLGFSDNTTAFIAMYSEVTEVIFHNGTFGGLIKINDLTTKINELVTTVNAMYGEYKAHTHAVSGAATGIPVPVPAQPDASSFTATDYENVKVKH